MLYLLLVPSRGRAIAQAVSRWLPTAAARVRSQVRSCGISCGRSGTGAGFLRVLPFPLPTFIPPNAPQSSSSIIRGWYNRPTVADVPSGLSLTPPRESKKKQSHPGDDSLSGPIKTNLVSYLSLIPLACMYLLGQTQTFHLVMLDMAQRSVPPTRCVSAVNVCRNFGIFNIELFSLTDNIKSVSNNCNTI
jgi:hypothetical protein